MKNQQNKPKNTNPFPAMEEEVLSFWEKNKIFEKSVKRDAPKGDYVFYDGPPFATGTPHYGHIVASIMKDVVPRYWTMKGFKVERKWGWDCHGLPIENIVEKELGFKSKKDIEELGIEKFNETCRSKVLTYVDEWKKVIRRLGRWADMENAYKTMDLDYMESIWFVFKQLYDKGLVYESYKSMHICPRCETTLSQMEVAEGYKTVKDLSATVKFKLDPGQKIGNFITDDNTYILAWTTTPWTLIGNVALAVGKDIEYTVLKVKSQKSKVIEQYIIATNRLEEVLKGTEYKVVDTIKGKDLIGLEYESIFDYYSEDKNLSAQGGPASGWKNRENGWKIYAGNFVNTDEGTGVVHIAPAFGEDDMNLGKEHNLPFVQHVGMDGTFKAEVKDFVGMHVKPIENTQATDIEIIKYLAHKDLLFSKEKYEHSYPHCWRCDTPLLNYATSSWFVDVTKIKDKSLELAKDINWTPKHIKEGRFGQWLDGARDWSISRQRFWASVIPIWKCDNKSKVKSQKSIKSCDELKVIGSVAELESLSGQKIDDLHKHIVDKITFPCEKCGGIMKRIPDVLDTWFDSGSMPYAQTHYPFENEKKFEENFPAEFIAEGVDQTRAWFYYLHVIATAIKDKPAFNNVIVNGIVLAEDGKKMSKRLQNYPDPSEIMEKFGADKLRYYLCSSSVVKAEDLNFSERDLAEQTRFFNVLLNVLTFYKMFNDQISDFKFQISDLTNVLDKWIIARLEETKKTITEKMDNYDLHAIREIPVFINDLSTWYIRRSRDRFKGTDEQDKQNALTATKYVLMELAKVMAPFIPFIAEHIYQELGADVESVHLTEWPKIREEWIDKEVLGRVALTRQIVEAGFSARDKAGIKVRQPLSSYTSTSTSTTTTLLEEDIDIAKEELNVKEIKFNDKEELDTKITPELKQEGIKRELVRAINAMRKEVGMTIHDRVIIYYQTDSQDIKQVFEKFGEEIKKETLADNLQVGSGEKVKINGEDVGLKIEKK